MKGLQIAVVLLVLCISTVEMLRCNSCVYENGQCPEVEEECEDSADECGTVIVKAPRYRMSKSCMTQKEIETVTHTGNCIVKTCNSDRCN